MSKKLPSVFKGLGGSTSHKAGYEGTLALTQQAQAPRGVATIRKKVETALDKDTPSAAYQLKQLYDSCRNHNDKLAAYDDGLYAGLTRQHYMRPSDEVLHLLGHVQHFHQRVPQILARTLGQIGTQAEALANAQDPRGLNDFDLFCKFVMRKPDLIEPALFTPVLNQLGPICKKMAGQYPTLAALMMAPSSPKPPAL